jgi:hypothetical protein
MNTDDIRNLRELLHRMQKYDPELRVFGSTHHKYRLGPPVSEEELTRFEQQYQVTLPAEYRFFLKEVGNGSAIHSSAPVISINSGAGPNYGLLPLQETAAGSDLSKPFPLLPSPPEQPVKGKDEWGDEVLWPGILEISHKGCAFYTYLVVNGPAYGTVWDADTDQVNFYPTGLTFEAWYRRWLDKVIDRALPMLANERLAARVSVGMTKAEVIRICGGRWQQKNIGGSLRFLYFEHLATQFQLDENDTVERIVRHSISLGK